jgi:malate dehydrogenase (oxaloacetate-decarboxylating)(NADP+)
MFNVWRLGFNVFSSLFFEKRKRRGFTLFEARKAMLERNYYGAMMVETGEADAMISGLTRKYSDTIRPSLQIIGVQKEIGMVAGMYIMVTKKGPVFFADTTINTNPTAEQLVKIVFFFLMFV